MPNLVMPQNANCQQKKLQVNSSLNPGLLNASHFGRESVTICVYGLSVLFGSAKNYLAKKEEPRVDNKQPVLEPQLCDLGKIT